MKKVYAAVLSVGMAGCATSPKAIGHEPTMTPVGAGLQANVVPHDFSARPPNPMPFNSLYTDKANLFRDPRAMRPGDVLTVNISINDQATIGNSSGRELDSTVNNQWDAGLGTSTSPVTIAGSFDSTSKSAANGTGTINRSEKIQLSVAAIVTEVMPDGNLMVAGSQEVRVNFELRQLSVAGIVRPRDISKDNTISYEKIAEARISYGGRGRLTEVQQPGIGQQIYDALKPF
ncbi:MAG: flagellar basal body L-ring protein FlgH [Beijerinckiaceae bacterium]|jgi:flagellar L-ring protein precursor FlgH